MTIFMMNLTSVDHYNQHMYKEKMVKFSIKEERFTVYFKESFNDGMSVLYFNSKTKTFDH